MTTATVLLLGVCIGVFAVWYYAARILGWFTDRPMWSKRK